MGIISTADLSIIATGLSQRGKSLKAVEPDGRGNSPR